MRGRPLLGRRVRTLVDGRRFPGRFTVQWDGTDGTAQPVASGVYVCRILAEDMRHTIKLVHVK